MFHIIHLDIGTLKFAQTAKWCFQLLLSIEVQKRFLTWGRKEVMEACVSHSMCGGMGLFIVTMGTYLIIVNCLVTIQLQFKPYHQYSWLAATDSKVWDMFQIQQKFCILIHQASVLIFVLTILTFKVALFLAWYILLSSVIFLPY